MFSLFQDVIITHHVDPLAVCMHEGPNPPCAKKDIIARGMTCEECNHYIHGIQNHLTGQENIDRFVHELHCLLYTSDAADE